MTQSVVSVDSLSGLSIAEFLAAVLEHQSRITVQFPTGEAVVIQPQPTLLSLPVLEGYVPQDWRDAIYR